MILSIILIILILLVGFIHYIQGTFSATLSAILAIVSAVIAVGFHENVVMAIKPGKMADSGTAVILCSMYAVTYVILRMIFDRLVPGNVRLQSTIDKVGAGVMGLVAGLFTAGVFAIAVQTMPFGPSIFGYSRYTLAPDRPDLSVPFIRGQQSKMRSVENEMKSESFDDKDLDKLLVPVDDLVLGTVSLMSDGSLSGTRSLNSVHPDYLREAFGTRIGVETGAKHTATNFDGQTQQVSVEKVSFTTSVKRVEDSELPELRRAGKKETKPDTGAVEEEAKLAKDPLKPGPDQVILIVRMVVDKNATDEKGSLFRFSPGSVRLVTHEAGDPNRPAKDNFPIGTMDAWSGGTFWPNHVDDFLFIPVESGNGADLVFLVKRDDVLTGAPMPKAKGATSAPAVQANAEIQPGTFLEVKRLARVDLSGMQAQTGVLPADPKISVLRKARLKAPPVPKPT